MYILYSMRLMLKTEILIIPLLTLAQFFLFIIINRFFWFDIKKKKFQIFLTTVLYSIICNLAARYIGIPKFNHFYDNTGLILVTALTIESGFRPTSKKVVMLSFPLTKIDPRSSNVYHSLRTCIHLSGTWIRPCTPVDSILEAILTAVKKSSSIFCTYVF